MRRPRIQVHRQRRNGRNAADVEISAGSVPKRDEARWSGNDEIHRPRDQSVVHDRRAAEIEPFDLERIEPGFCGMLFDQVVLAHHQQRQEADPAGTGRNPDDGVRATRAATRCDDANYEQ